MIKNRTAAMIGVIASAMAIAVIAFDSDQVSNLLGATYRYPTESGLSLDGAASWTQTYLFLIAGSAFAVGVAYVLARPLRESRIGWWIASGLVVAGVVVVTYNATQAIPPAIKIVSFLPVAAGIVWLLVARPGQQRSLPEPV